MSIDDFWGRNVTNFDAGECFFAKYSILYVEEEYETENIGHSEAEGQDKILVIYSAGA